MSQQQYPAFTKLDAFKEFLFRFAAKGYVPYHWYNKNLPHKNELSSAGKPLKLEIVSHCWQYSQLLTYQLSSIVKYPITNLELTFTVFYSKEDIDTSKVLDFFADQQAKNITWNFIALPKEQLFRRAIGRNIAAKQSKADWIWFTDCDVVFHENALDQMAGELAGITEPLVYPKKMQVTELLPKDDPLFEQVRHNPSICELETTKFTERTFTRATGPIQIVHGHIARTCGYCDDLPVYQKTMPSWSKCYDDRAFRWLINSQGYPIEVNNIFFIRHVEKGRYKKDSGYTKVRKFIRKTKSSLIGR